MNEKNSKASSFRWIVLAIIFMVYAIAGADRANIGVVAPYIKKELALTNIDIGEMASLFFISYAFMQLVIGGIFTKFKVKYIFILAIVLTSAATFVMGLADSAIHLKMARLLLGIAEAALPIGILTTINRWFPTCEKGTATSIFLAAIKFAPAIVPPVCAYIISNIGWREVFFAFGIPGFIVAILWWYFVTDTPNQSKYVNAAELAYIQESTSEIKEKNKLINYNTKLDKLIKTQYIKPLNSPKAILTSFNIWGCALAYFFMLGLNYVIMTWLPTYLVSVKQLAIIKMGFVASTPWIGAIIGNLIGGYLSDKVFEKRRKPLMLISAIATVVTMFALLSTPSTPIMLGLLLLIVGILLNLGFSIYMSYPMGLATQKTYPLAASVVNFMGGLGAAFAPVAVGYILELTNGNFDYVFGYLGITAAITFVILLMIIEPLQRKEA